MDGVRLQESNSWASLMMEAGDRLGGLAVCAVEEMAPSRTKEARCMRQWGYSAGCTRSNQSGTEAAGPQEGPSGLRNGLVGEVFSLQAQECEINPQML